MLEWLVTYNKYHSAGPVHDAQSEPVLPADLQFSTFPGLQITGTVGRTFRIESSRDMSTRSPAATLLLTSSPYSTRRVHPGRAAERHLTNSNLVLSSG